MEDAEWGGGRGSSHSIDGRELWPRPASYRRYDSHSAGNNKKKKPHKITLPSPRARLTSYPSDGSRSRCDSSSDSPHSYSSGRTTPIIPPSTPIVPGEPPLAFDFSDPSSLKELTTEER